MCICLLRVNQFSPFGFWELIDRKAKYPNIRKIYDGCLYAITYGCTTVLYLKTQRMYLLLALRNQRLMTRLLATERPVFFPLCKVQQLNMLPCFSRISLSHGFSYSQPVRFLPRKFLPLCTRRADSKILTKILSTDIYCIFPVIENGLKIPVKYYSEVPWSAALALRSLPVQCVELFFASTRASFTKVL